jgi:hypothetical protein
VKIVIGFSSFALLGALLFFASCKKDLLSKLTTSGHEAVDAYQLATAELGVQNIFAAKVDSNASGSSTLAFTSEGELSSLRGNALFPILNQQADFKFSLSLAEINTMTSTGSLQKTYSDTASFQLPNQALIKNIKFKAGQLRIKYSTTCKHDHALTLSIPLLKQGAVSFTQQLQLPYTGILPAQQESVFDLSDFTLNLAFNGSAPVNRFLYTLKDSMSYIGNSLQIDDSTSISLSFTGLTFSNVDGNFGSLVIPPVQSSFSVPLFNQVSSGALHFKAPVLDVSLQNSLGMPLTFLWEQLTGYSPITGLTPLLGDTLGRAWSYGVPSAKGKTAVRSVKLNSTNTNLTSLLAYSPTTLLMAGRDSANQISTSYTYFLTDSSAATVDAQLLLPLEGSFEDLLLTDTIDLNLAALQGQTIKALRIYMENKFPLQATIQAWPVDQGGMRGEALLTEEGFIVSAGIAKTNGLVSSPTVVTQTIELSGFQLDQLLNAKKMILGVNFKSEAGLDVKLNMSSKIKVNIGVQSVR